MEEEVKVSKFNTAVSKEIRRAAIWDEANNHSRTHNFSKWNEDLDCIWRELCADLVKKDKDSKDGVSLDRYKKKKEDFDALNKKIGKIVDKVYGFKKPTSEEVKERIKQYDTLQEKEIFLRLLENELGKGTAYEDDDDDEF